MKNNNYYFNQVIDVITHPIFAVLWLGLATSSYFFWDKPLAIYMHQLTNQVVLQSAQIVTLLGYGKYYLVLSIIAVILLLILKQRRLAMIALFFLVSVLITGVICDVLKIMFSRARPTELYQNDMYGFYFFHLKAKFWSFPSGHATTAATVMIAASFFWPRIWPLFITLMLAVAASRVILGVHFLSDVMVGLYLGSMVTIILVRYAKKYI